MRHGRGPAGQREQGNVGKGKGAQSEIQGNNVVQIRTFVMFELPGTFVLVVGSRESNEFRDDGVRVGDKHRRTGLSNAIAV